MNINNLLFKGAVLVAAGGCTLKAIQAVNHYKKQKELYEEVEEDLKEEK